MALGLKVLAIGAVLGGGCIGIPLCLIKGSESQVVNVPKSTNPVAAAKEPELKPAKKVECTSSVVNQNSQNFLRQRDKDPNLYSSVICDNIVVKGPSPSLFNKELNGLFPKKVIDEIFLTKGGSTFKMNIEENTEDGMGGTQVKITFSNPETSSSVRGKLDILDETHMGKRAVTVSIEGKKYNPKEIYLFISI